MSYALEGRCVRECNERQGRRVAWEVAAAGVRVAQWAAVGRRVMAMAEVEGAAALCSSHSRARTHLSPAAIRAIAACLRLELSSRPLVDRPCMDDSAPSPRKTLQSAL